METISVEGYVATSQPIEGYSDISRSWAIRDSSGTIVGEMYEGSRYSGRAWASMTKLLADFFEIDLKKISAEKDEMYGELVMHEKGR